MNAGELYRENGYLHVNWGQGMMVAGRNPLHWERRPRFEIKAA